MSIDALATRVWVGIPRRLLLRFPAVRGVAGDGYFLGTVPVVGVALPALAVLFGLLAGVFRLGYDVVFTESLALLVVFVALGMLSTQVAALSLVGFVIGDIISTRGPGTFGSSSSIWFSGPLASGPLAHLAHVRLPMVIAYLMLAAVVIALPRAARSVTRSVGRGRQLGPVTSWVVVTGLLTAITWLGVDAWLNAAPTLTRPVFTWRRSGALPTAAAIAPLQRQGGWIMASALAALAVRQAWLLFTLRPGRMRDRLIALENDPPPPPSALRPRPARPVLSALLTATLATLALAGILEQALMWPIAFGAFFTVRWLASGQLDAPWLQSWRRVANRAPAWARLIGLWVLSRVAVQALRNDMVGSYTALAVVVVVSVVLVFLVFPGPSPQTAAETPRQQPPHGPPPPPPPPGARLAALVLGAWIALGLRDLLAAPAAYADNCGTFSDCFGVLNSALEAAIGLSLLAILSIVLDFVPFVGTGKGIIEAITGRDLLTGAELAWWERALGILPIVGGLTALKYADDLAALGRHGDDAGDVTRHADDLVQTGGSTRPRDPYDIVAQDAWAQRRYDEFRASDADLSRIVDGLSDVPRADGTTFTREQLEQIKQHLFRDSHPLDDYQGGTSLRQFDPDAEIAAAWDRLQAGTPRDSDIVLLEHELAESTLMRQNPGMTYREAHQLANQRWNWQDIIESGY